MADENTLESRSIGGGADALAAQIAMRSGADMDSDAREYLKKQARLADLQIENLQKQDEFEVSHLRWRRVGDQMMGALQFVAVALGLLLFLAIGGAVWSAANDNGLVIEAFGVPSDFTARGLSGQVVASQVLDKLSQFEAATVSSRASSSYANNWGDDIKVQIPDTGVSIGELSRLLRGWLGHETHISGEIWRTPTGLAVTARISGAGSATFRGSEADLDKLLQKAAEGVYRATQPYRYAVYLLGVGRTKEAEAEYESLIANGSNLDRVWAYIGIANIYSAHGDFVRLRRALDQALELRPNFALAYDNLDGMDSTFVHDEANYRDLQAVVKIRRQARESDTDERVWDIARLVDEAALASITGDYKTEAAFARRTEDLPEFNNFVENARQNEANADAGMHDGVAADRVFDGMPPVSDPQLVLTREGNRAVDDLLLGTWDRILTDRSLFESGLAKAGPIGPMVIGRQVWPWVAYGLALKGDFAGAHALVDKTPVDCSLCLRLRGRIDALEKNWNGAGYWFARATRDAPSPPFSWTNWGQMLLDKGDPDAAIEKFAIANKKGPHFADPMEMWGEALMAKNRSDLALAKFAEATGEAPNWGRLHLKWGEALHALNRRDEAREQWRIASGLGLTAAERAELARVSKR